MAKILAVDYGTKRTGLAITDDLKMIATPLDTISSSELIDYLSINIPKQKIDTIVIGEPKKLNNTEADIHHLIIGLERKIKKLFTSVNVVKIDERFTSKMASATIFQSGIGKKKRQDKGLIDKISACIILQSYLESI